MSNSDKLLEFWERSLEQAFARSSTRAPTVRILGDRLNADRLPFNIQVRHDPVLQNWIVEGDYRLGMRQVISAMQMELTRPDLIDMTVHTANRVVRRAIARRLMEDATSILAEGEIPAQLMGMDVIVTENLPENVGMLVHPRPWAFIISSTMDRHNQLEWHNPNA